MKLPTDGQRRMSGVMEARIFLFHILIINYIINNVTNLVYNIK